MWLILQGSKETQVINDDHELERCYSSENHKEEVQFPYIYIDIFTTVLLVHSSNNVVVYQNWRISGMLP